MPASLTSVIRDKDREIEQLRIELSQRDALLDEMQNSLNLKAEEADELLAQAGQIANEVCACEQWVLFVCLCMVQFILTDLTLQQTKACLLEQLEEKEKQNSILQTMLDDTLSRVSRRDTLSGQRGVGMLMKGQSHVMFYLSLLPRI